MSDEQRREYICVECGKRGTWGRGWRHLIEAHWIWCSAECEDATTARSPRVAAPHETESWALWEAQLP
jgi:hypothetical protein